MHPKHPAYTQQYRDMHNTIVLIQLYTHKAHTNTIPITITILPTTKMSNTNMSNIKEDKILKITDFTIKTADTTALKRTSSEISTTEKTLCKKTEHRGHVNRLKK